VTSAQGDTLIAACQAINTALQSGGAMSNRVFGMTYAAAGIQWCFVVLLMLLFCAIVMMLRKG
jgi:hypothetical protein